MIKFNMNQDYFLKYGINFKRKNCYRIRIKFKVFKKGLKVYVILKDGVYNVCDDLKIVARFFLKKSKK